MALNHSMINYEYKNQRNDKTVHGFSGGEKKIHSAASSPQFKNNCNFSIESLLSKTSSRTPSHLQRLWEMEYCLKLQNNKAVRDGVETVQKQPLRGQDGIQKLTNNLKEYEKITAENVDSKYCYNSKLVPQMLPYVPKILGFPVPQIPRALMPFLSSPFYLPGVSRSYSFPPPMPTTPYVSMATNNSDAVIRHFNQIIDSKLFLNYYLAYHLLRSH